MSEEIKIKSVDMHIDIVQAIMNYLGTKPYGEVANIVNAIQAEVGKALEAEKARIANLPKITPKKQVVTEVKDNE